MSEKMDELTQYSQRIEAIQKEMVASTMLKELFAVRCDLIQVQNSLGDVTMRQLYKEHLENLK